MLRALSFHLYTYVVIIGIDRQHHMWTYVCRHVHIVYIVYIILLYLCVLIYVDVVFSYASTL